MNPNPFDQDGVIRILLEEADIPTLKILRELNTNWNSLDLKELEIRASEGKFRECNFSWGQYENIKTEEEANEYILNFLESTSANPQLFCDFRFNFPKSLKILNASFFAKYPPMFIHLHIKDVIVINEDNMSYTISELLNFIRLVAPTLKELGVGYGRSSFGSWIPEILEIPEESQLVFPKLTKFTAGYLCRPMLSQFRIILDKGGEVDPAPNLKELSVVKRTSIDFGNLLGIDTGSKVSFQRWSNLTHLTLYIDNDIKSITQHLCTLAQYGMTLIHLSLNFRGEIYRILEDFFEICQNLSQIFDSQSQSLQSLGLSISLKVNVVEEVEVGEICLISLPIFPQVFKLILGQLDVRVNGARLIPLQMETFPFHFPKLTDLEIRYSYVIFNSITDLFARVNLVPLPLRELTFEIYGATPSGQILDWMRSNFSSVLRLGIKSSEQNNEIPWEDSLEFLQLSYVNAPIKLAHLTHLKTLVVYEKSIGNSTNKYRKSVHSYLEHFQEVVSLNLNTIHFQTEKEICDVDQSLIRSYFPFKVIFTFKPLLLY